MEVVKNRDVTSVECSHCTSDLNITKHDLEYNYHMGHHSYLYVVCGACGEKVEVQEKLLPIHWRGHVQNVIRDEMGDDFD